MRTLAGRFFNLILAIHVFVNKKPVKATGSLLYVVGAVVVTLARNQIRAFGRVLLQSPQSAQLKALVIAGMNNLGSVFQFAETMFR